MNTGYGGVRNVRLASSSAVSAGRAVGQLASPLRRMLANDQHTAALEYFYRYMRDKQLDNELRFQAYVKSISLFMVHGHVADAYNIYGRMQDEGYIPPMQIQASIFVMQVLSTGDSAEILLEAAKKAFASDTFGEEEFRYFLRIISSVTRLPPKVYDDLIDLFIQSRGEEGYTLKPATQSLISYIRTRRGWRGAEHQDQLSQEEASSVQTGEGRSEHIDVLISMANKDPQLAPVIYSTVRRMQLTGGNSDRIFYNNLLALFHDNHRGAEAMALYRMMLLGTVDILPDAFTFGTMFRMIAYFSAPRSARVRQHKKPEDLPTLREVYQDMVVCHQKHMQARASAQDDAKVINGSLMNKVLRNFIDNGDFAAAYIALRAYKLYNIPVTLTTYRAIMGSIVLRMREEFSYLRVGQDNSRSWTFRFLGSPATIPNEIDIRVLDGVLSYGAHAALNMEPIELVSPEEIRRVDREMKKHIAQNNGSDMQGLTFKAFPHQREGRPAYRVPTAMTLLQLIASRIDEWDVVPLLRILRRAILASRSHLFLPASKVVSMEIRYARTEMLPAEVPAAK